MVSFLTKLFSCSPPTPPLPGFEFEDEDDPDPPHTIQHLSFDEIFEILKRLDDKSLDQARNVCQLWHEIIDRWIGSSVNLSTRKVVRPGNNPAVAKTGLDLIPEIGVRKLSIDRHQLHYPGTTPPPSFKYPALLQSLTISAKIYPELFPNLVKGTVNLTSLAITLPALIQLDNEDLKGLPFPKLMELRIKCFVHIVPSNRRPLALALPNLKTLLEGNQLLLLTSLNIDLPVRSFSDLEGVGFLLPAISRYPRLRELTLRLCFPHDSISVQPININVDELRRIITGIRGRPSGPSFIRKLTLETILLRGPVPPESPFPHRRILDELLLQQSSLEELTCSSISSIPILDPVLAGLCSRNGATLTKLSIRFLHFDFDLPDVDQAPLNLAIFSPLTSLRELEFCWDRVITGAASLPPTLVTLCLGNVILPDSDQVEHILLNLPNLREIKLLPMDCQVRLETLHLFVQNRKAELLWLIWEGFPREGISNGCALQPETLSYPRDGGGGLLRWKRSEIGSYTNDYPRN